jgi:phage I-like protein
MTKLSLIALSVLFAAKAMADGATTVKIDMAVVGKWEGHQNGAFEITAADLQQIKTNFENQKVKVVIDYEHATLWGGKAPAAGWVVALEVEGDKLIGEVEWTQSAIEHIKQEVPEYRYISPVLDPHTIDQVTGEDIGWSLHSAALTNKPFLEELGEIKAAKNQPNPKQEEHTPMTPEEKAQLDAATTENTSLKDENKTLKEQNDALVASQAEATVDGAIAAKKISPDQKDWALKYCKNDKAGFDEFLKNAKPATQVPANDQFAASNTQSTAAISMKKV